MKFSIEIIGIEILTLKSHKVVLEKNITVLNLKLLWTSDSCFLLRFCGLLSHLTNQLLHHAPLILNGLIKLLKPMALYIQFSNGCYLPCLFVFVDNTCITGVMKGWQFSYILPRTGNPDRQGPRALYTDSRAHADCHLNNHFDLFSPSCCWQVCERKDPIHWWFYSFLTLFWWPV